MDSATRAALLVAMVGGPEPVTVVTGDEISPVTAETGTSPPFVTGVTVLPAGSSNPAEAGPLNCPRWSEAAEPVSEHEFFEAAALPDFPVFPVTPVTRKQTADSCGFPALPAENVAGNTGNTAPFRHADLAALETIDLIARAELLYGGQIGLNANGPVWRKHTDQPPAEVMAVLKERRSDVQAVLAARSSAIKTRTREPDTWTADDWPAFYDERAGIREFDGQLPRPEAERLAMADCAQHWLLRKSPAPHGPENGCWQCGQAGTDADGADPLTSRNCRGGVFWIHPRCWADYDVAADAAAKAAIGASLRSAS